MKAIKFFFGKNPFAYLFTRTWRYSEGNRKAVGSFWAMFVIAQILSMTIPPLIMAKLIDVVQKQGITAQNIGTLELFLGLSLAFCPLIWCLHGPARVMECKNSFRARANYRKYLLKGVMTLAMEWHAEHHSGDTIDKIEKGTSGLFDFSGDSFVFIYAVVQLAVSYCMLIYFNPSSAYIVFAMTLVMAMIVMQFDKILVGQYVKLNRSENLISESVFDAVSNITTVIILRVERLVFEAIAHKVDEPYDLFARNSRLSETKWFLVSVCCRVTTVLVLGTYFFRHIGASAAVLAGNLYILIRYLDEVSDVFSKFTARYSEVLRRRAKVMNAEELSGDFRVESFTNHVLPPDWKSLQIEGLTFSYDTKAGADVHLDSLSFALTRGERVAFVGESGSGKTTLLKIMRDLYHPQQMMLSVDGNRISGFDGISRAIALVPQNPEIFATSILENITLGAEYEPAFVRRFTDMACFTNVIEDLPHGLDSSTKEKGVNLSGGQQQRLALARGLLACEDKQIVLLDEPTSSLDTANEMRVYQNIFREFAGKTIISSIHRLHLLALFDRICFMKDGQIIASGNLSDLLLICPEFQGLWQQYHSRHHEAMA